jgi:hypothetical protein
MQDGVSQAGLAPGLLGLLAEQQGLAECWCGPAGGFGAAKGHAAQAYGESMQQQVWQSWRTVHSHVLYISSTVQHYWLPGPAAAAAVHMTSP